MLMSIQFRLMISDCTGSELAYIYTHTHTHTHKYSNMYTCNYTGRKYIIDSKEKNVLSYI